MCPYNIMYKQKYLKYKSKYLNLKMQQGSKNNVEFILFGDVMTGSNIWFYDFDENKINFVDKLKELGNVIILNPNYVNFMRYGKENKENPNRLYAPKKGDIHFKIEDLQFENYADWVYNQINKNKKYVAIGLDQGAHFAKYFVNKYNDNCLALFILRDRILTKENYEKVFHSQTNYDFIKSIVGNNWEKYIIENLTNDIIDELLHKIINEKDNDKYIDLLNGICKGIIRNQYNKIKYMKVKTFIYSDIETATPEKIELNKKFNKESNNKIIYYYVIHDTDYLIHGKYENEIYARINYLVNNE